jgi:hypothetical protein
MASSLRVNAIVPASGTNVAIGTAGGTITYTASVSGVSTFSSGVVIGTGASIFSPATNILTLGTANTEDLRIDAAGNIGIGSTGILNSKVYVSAGSSTQTPVKVDFISESYSTGSGAQYTYFPTGTSINIVNTNSVSSAANLIYLETRGSSGFNGSYIGAVDAGGSSGANNLVFGSRTGATTWTERVRIDTSGRVTKPYQPAFSVYPASGTPIGSGALTFTGVRFNIGSHYSTSTGRFTAPVAGIYLMILTAQHYGGTATNGFIDILLNGAEINARYETFDGAQYTSGGISAVVQMAVGDYITISTSGNVFHDDNTNFSGYLLG